MGEKYYVTIEEVNLAAQRVATAIRIGFDPGYGGDGYRLYGIPRGGIPAAFAVNAYLSGSVVTDNLLQANIFIDDIYDSGCTSDRYMAQYGKSPFILFDKRNPKWRDKWLVMPWEVSEKGDKSATDSVTRLLQYIGEDPTREGLKETPARVLAAWKEWATGYGQNPGEVLKAFEDGADGCDELVIVHDIPFISKCEHHLADIIGYAHVGYIPRGKIVGLSKLARLVEIFARRLQVQERATNQIADALVEHLNPIGAGVLIRASHACMSTRGVKVHGSTTTTSAMRGALLNKDAARKEFMDLCAMAERAK